MEFEVRLFDTTSLAADGSNIPRRSCEEYLSSVDYETIIRDKVAVGGLSHKDRKLKPELKGIVGMDDQVLINDNALFYITKLYFKEGSNFLYARAKMFDPDLFAGARRDNILNLIGMLESGVRMPVSVVIQALWSKRGVAEKIIRIKGFDFTQNPSFKGAGDIKIFSEIINTSNEVVEVTGVDGDVLTKAYSMDSEISLLNSTELFSKLFELYPEQTSFSYFDIIKVYGQGSQQEKSIRDKQYAVIPKEDLKTVTPSATSDDDNNMHYWYKKLKGMVSDDDQEALEVLYRGNPDTFMKIMQSVPVDDPNRDELLRARLEQFFRVEPDKQYSLNPNTVSDRVRSSNQPRYLKFQQLIRTYKKYLESTKLNENQLLKCKLLFLQDINFLVKDVTSEIYSGRTLTTIYGLQQYGKDVREKANELSSSYRKLMIAERMLQFVPKNIYGEWMIDAKAFYQSLIQYTFNEPLSDLEFNLLKL